MVVGSSDHTGPETSAPDQRRHPGPAGQGLWQRSGQRQADCAPGRGEVPAAAADRRPWRRGGWLQAGDGPWYRYFGATAGVLAGRGRADAVVLAVSGEGVYAGSRADACTIRQQSQDTRRSSEQQRPGARCEQWRPTCQQLGSGRRARRPWLPRASLWCSHGTAGAAPKHAGALRRACEDRGSMGPNRDPAGFKMHLTGKVSYSLGGCVSGACLSSEYSRPQDSASQQGGVGLVLGQDSSGQFIVCDLVQVPCASTYTAQPHTQQLPHLCPPLSRACRIPLLAPLRRLC